MINTYCVYDFVENTTQHTELYHRKAQKGFPLWDDRPQKLRRKTLINVYHGL